MANVVFMEGFDSYDSANTQTSHPGFHSKWYIPNAGNVNFQPGRFGGQCLHMGDDDYGNQVRAYFNGNPYLTSMTIGFAMFCGNVTATERYGQFLNLMHDQGDQVGIAITNIGQYQLWRGGSLLAQSIPNLTRQGDWNYLEVELYSNTTNGRMSLYLDGALVVEYRGNTQNQLAYGINGIQFGGPSGNGYLIDDLYVTSTSARLGERKIETLRPNADVSTAFTPSTGTSNFAMLNETLVNDTTYTTGNAVNATDMFEFTDLATLPSVIDAIQLNVFATKTDVATRQMVTLVTSGTQTTVGPTYNLPQNHLNMNRIENTDPNTGTDWTADGVDAIQAGYKIIT